jgi:hypothetical protein
VSTGFCQDRPVLVVHAPGGVHFDLPRGSHRVLGEFGTAPGAYEQGQTDGVLFTVECISDNTTPVILYERHLDPVHESRDRGLQTLRLDLPEGTEGRLIFRTSNKPGNNTGIGRIGLALKSNELLACRRCHYQDRCLFLLESFMVFKSNMRGGLRASDN